MLNRQLLIFIIPLVTIIAVILAWPPRDAGKNEVERREFKSQDQMETNPDRDGDGLKDWEEKLWTTDPDNPDSDSDGTSDGVEVSAGRHPLKKGPSDSLMFEIISTATTQNTVTISPQISPFKEKPTISRYFTEQADKVASEAVSPRNELKEYGNSLASALLSFENASLIESSTFRKLLEDGTMDESRMTEASLSYAERAKYLSKINPPKEITSLHENLISRLFSHAEAIKMISASGNSISKETWQVYSDIAIKSVSAIGDIIDFFHKKNIKFLPGESGVIFNDPN